MQLNWLMYSIATAYSLQTITPTSVSVGAIDTSGMDPA